MKLDDPNIKIMTLKSVKGLEFPAVAIAGLLPSYPGAPPAGAPEEHIRSWSRMAGALYVAMTRAKDSYWKIVE
ncbi:MAG: 3'-5' exonuclease [Thermomicrobiales bacterium]